MQDVTSNAFTNMVNLTTLSLRDNELGRELKYEMNDDEETSRENNNGQLMIPSEMKKMLQESESTLVHLSLSALDPMNLPNVQFIDLGLNVFHGILQSESPFSRFKRKYKNTSSSSRSANVQEFTGTTWTHLKQLSLDGCAIEFLEKGSLDGLISLSILRLNNNSLKVRDREK